MKKHLVLIALVLFFFTVTISTSAQSPSGTPGAASPKPAATQTQPVVNVPATKIGLADTTVFGDEKAGITRYLKAVKAVEREFQPKQDELTNLEARLKTIADEINKLSGASVVNRQAIQAKQDEGEQIQRDLKYKKEQADTAIAKRYKEVVGPISEDIGRALDQFATKHGLTMILDLSKLLPAVLTVNPAMDITTAFIAEYNSKNP